MRFGRKRNIHLLLMMKGKFDSEFILYHLAMRSRSAKGRKSDRRSDGGRGWNLCVTMIEKRIA